MTADLRVLLAAPGLDHAHRGFETFARECFDALRDRPGLSIELVKGSGPGGPEETTVPTLLRDTRTAKRLGRASSREPFVFEHLSFAASLVPIMHARRPDVVFFSEWHVGRTLGAWRRVGGARCALVLSNGALAPSGYGHLDLVQQLVPGAFDFAVARGEPPDRQVMLPLGVAIESVLPPLERDARAALRRELGLPTERRIVLSAGAINRQKRMDHLVEEVASMPGPRPFLLLAGQQESDTPSIRRLAVERLGMDGHDIRTVPPSAMAELYRASDAFVLASEWESFGRVLVEAQSHGLPCLAHDYPVMRWVLGDEGTVADLRERGAVSRWLCGPSAIDLSEPARRRRHAAAYQRFSWDVLADRYVEMLHRAREERR